MYKFGKNIDFSGTLLAMRLMKQKGYFIVKHLSKSLKTHFPGFIQVLLTLSFFVLI